MSVLTWLDASAFAFAGVPVTWAEVLGDLTGGLSVWLLARQNVWNWPIGLANNVFWALLFFRSKLYGDAVLQGVFFVLGCYGWWHWARTAGRADVGRVRRTRRLEWVVLGALTFVATIAAALWLRRETDSPVPLADASVLTLSLAATWGQAYRWLESWWVWIFVDVISVPLYVSRALYPTAILYFAFGLLCVQGLRAWSRDLATREEAET